MGIYMIINTINNKKYIGQSKDIEKRWKSHKQKSTNIHLRRAISIYGNNAFSYIVIQEIICSKDICQPILDALEIFYIQYYGTQKSEYGYNVKPGGNGGYKLNEESCKKISEKHRGRKQPPHVGEAVRKAQMGRKQSLETIAKRVKKLRGQKRSEEFIQIARKRMVGKIPSELCRQRQKETATGKILTEETKKKIGENNIGKHKITPEHREKLNKSKHKKILCLDNGLIYSSSKEAEISLMLPRGKIGMVCSGRRKHTRGYHFRYYTEEVKDA